MSEEHNVVEGLKSCVTTFGELRECARFLPIDSDGIIDQRVFEKTKWLESNAFQERVEGDHPPDQGWKTFAPEHLVMQVL
ncbi:MAG: hypothetical protein RL097_188 [Candidatus Parcubacteria bacterium]|jgi:hypothetical protein